MFDKTPHERSVLEAYIPPAKLESVRSALRETFDTEDVEEIELLTGGLSSAMVYKIIVRGQNYVLRLIIKPDMLNDPERQYSCMLAAADGGVAPHVQYTNVKDALAIMTFIQAQPADEQFSGREALLEGLAQTIRKVHSLSLFPPLVDFMEGVNIFIQQFKELQMFPEAATEDCFRLYAQIQDNYVMAEEDIVSSHNDLNPNNLLFNEGRIWIIDWEAAFRNDRYVDLAIGAKPFVQGPEQEEAFLLAYFGATLNQEKRDRFFIVSQVCSMYYAMVMFRLAATARSADFAHNDNMQPPDLDTFMVRLKNKEVSLDTYESKLYYGKALIKGLIGNMRSDRFVCAMERFHRKG